MNKLTGAPELISAMLEGLDMFEKVGRLEGKSAKAAKVFETASKGICVTSRVFGAKDKDFDEGCFSDRIFACC